MKRVAVGIDIGATTTRIALVDEQGKAYQKERFPTKGADGPDFIINKLDHRIRALRERNTDLTFDGIGVSAAVVPDPSTDRVLFAPNLPRWQGLNLKERLTHRFRSDVIVGNDTNMAVIGEFHFGAGVGRTNMTYIKIGTGVGGGIIIGRQLLVGQHGFASEVGHIPVSEDGPECSCGRRGHLEAYLSGPGIARAYRLRRTEVEQDWSSPEQGPSRMDAQGVLAAARRGDVIANEVIRQAGYYLGIASSIIISLLDPEVIVIGGGVSEAGALLLRPANEELRRRIPDRHPTKVQLVQTLLGDDAPLIGAAWMAISGKDHLSFR